MAGGHEAWVMSMSQRRARTARAVIAVTARTSTPMVYVTTSVGSAARRRQASKKVAPVAAIAHPG